jgi:hemolysin activation/secretion protein
MVGARGKAAATSALAGTAALLVPFGGYAARAQVAPPPAAVQSAAPTREEVTRPDLTPAPRAPSKLTVEGGIERAPCALADARFADVKITLKAAQFANLHDIPPEMLRPAYADMIGKTLSISAVCEIRDAAATILRNAGYLAAVQVPPQTIKDGIVYFDVLMPKLVAVQVRGQAGKSEQLIAAYLNRLTAKPVFNEHDAERYLLLARDLPGYDVRLTLRPANDGVPGDVIGEVSVLRQPYAIDFNVQDYGSRSVGRYGGLLRGEFYDVLGHGDRLSLGLFSTSDFDEQKVVQTGYDFHVGPEGMSIGGNFTYAWTHPDIPNLNVRSRTLVANINARYPFLRSQTADLASAVGLDFVNQDLKFAGLPFSQDHIRTLYANLGGDVTDRQSIRNEGGYSAAEPHWRLSGTFEVRKGIGAFDATGHCYTAASPCNGANSPVSSRPDAEPRGVVLRFSATAEWRPDPKVALVLSPQAQWAPSPTLQYDQFSAGNYTVGRGYDAGAIRGDSGVGLSGEVRYGSLVPHTSTALAWQPYAFIDAAWTWIDSSDYVAASHDHLVSAGGGIRLAWGTHARLDLGVAVPLEKVAFSDPSGDPLRRRSDTRVLFSITTRLLPWRR